MRNPNGNLLEILRTYIYIYIYIIHTLTYTHTLDIHLVCAAVDINKIGTTY